MIIVDNALKEREASGNPIRVGMIGAGFMARGIANQMHRYMRGMRLVAIANRSVENAVVYLRRPGWVKPRKPATSSNSSRLSIAASRW